MKEPETETETNQDERLKDEVGHGELWEKTVTELLGDPAANQQML